MNPGWPRKYPSLTTQTTFIGSPNTNTEHNKTAKDVRVYITITLGALVDLFGRFNYKTLPS